MKSSRSTGVFACALALLSAPTLLAQTSTPTAGAARAETGTISGRVIDQATGDPLENARVILAGTAILTNTERGGQFTLPAVPAGDYVLVVSYTGFDSVSRPVQANGGRQTAVKIEMSSGPVAMEAFVVNFRRGDRKSVV